MAAELGRGAAEASGAGDTLRRRVDELLGPAAAGTQAAPAASTGGEETGPRGAAAERGRRWASRAAAFGREHLAVVIIIAIAGCLWAGVSMTQARSVPVPVSSAGLSPGPAPAAPTSSPPPPVVVHVLGAVASPGVVRLSPGSRVADAIAAAGGLLHEARPGELNLAALLADGSQLVIGTPDQPGGSVRGTGGTAGPAGEAASGVVDLNTATVEQLDTLPGVGPVTAQAIVSWREKHGRFSRIEELQEVDGVGPKTFAQLAPKVTVR